MVWVCGRVVEVRDVGDLSGVLKDAVVVLLLANWAATQKNPHVLHHARPWD